MPAAEQEILDAFQDSGAQVQKLVSLIRNPRKWSIHAVDPPLSSFVRGHTALVGDAAHGMCPHLGAGVGQGFEDALVLCKLLGHSETALTNLEVRAHRSLGSFRAFLLGCCFCRMYCAFTTEYGDHALIWFWNGAP